MAFVFCNPNPKHLMVDDCAIRACAIALDQTWDETDLDICALSNAMCNIPSANVVWGKYLTNKGWKTKTIDDHILRHYTVKDFCYDHPYGIYVLGIGDHVVTVIDGDYYDIWDSGSQVVAYYFRKE